MFNEKVLEKELNHIIVQLQEQTGKKEAVVRENLNQLKKILQTKEKKDKTPEEIIKVLFSDVSKAAVAFLENYNLVPGLNVAAKINNVQINFNQGFKNHDTNDRLTSNIMFDIASISKTFIAIIIYQLIEEGVLNFNTKVRDILPNLKNLPADFTLSEMTKYTVMYKTEGRVDEASSKEEAEKILASISIDEEKRGQYNYNDMVSMLMVKVVEKVTNKTYLNLVTERIVEPLSLQEIVFGGQVPNDKKDFITGSPNINKGMVNDPKANIFGGLHGNAGIYTSTGDAIKVLENLINGGFFKLNTSDFYNINPSRNNRAVSGQAIIPSNYYGGDSYSKISTGSQGSTRTTSSSGIYNINGIKYVVSDSAFTNSANINPVELKKIAKQSQVDLAKIYKKYENSNTVRVDIRQIVGSDSLDKIMVELSKFELNVAVLQAFIKAYEPNYEISMNEDYKDSNLMF